MMHFTSPKLNASLTIARFMFGTNVAHMTHRAVHLMLTDAGHRRMMRTIRKLTKD